MNDDQARPAGQQMGGSQGDTHQPQQQQQGSSSVGQSGSQTAPRPVRYTDWASI